MRSKLFPGTCDCQCPCSRETVNGVWNVLLHSNVACIASVYGICRLRVICAAGHVLIKDNDIVIFFNFSCENTIFAAVRQICDICTSGGTMSGAALSQCQKIPELKCNFCSAKPETRWWRWRSNSGQVRNCPNRCKVSDYNFF